MLIGLGGFLHRRVVPCRALPCPALPSVVPFTSWSRRPALPGFPPHRRAQGSARCRKGEGEEGTRAGGQGDTSCPHNRGGGGWGAGAERSGRDGGSKWTPYPLALALGPSLALGCLSCRMSTQGGPRPSAPLGAHKVTKFATSRPAPPRPAPPRRYEFCSPGREPLPLSLKT